MSPAVFKMAGYDEVNSSSVTHLCGLHYSVQAYCNTTDIDAKLQLPKTIQRVACVNVFTKQVCPVLLHLKASQ
jgi:hypothetical protein